MSGNGEAEKRAGLVKEDSEEVRASSCPLLVWSVPGWVTPGTVRHAGDFPGQVACGLTPVRQRLLETVCQPGKHPVRRQRRWHTSSAPGTAHYQYPPLPLCAVGRQVHVG
ncbi:hypothetical protein ACLBOM_19955 [Escherichia coli]